MYNSLILSRCAGTPAPQSCSEAESYGDPGFRLQSPHPQWCGCGLFPTPFAFLCPVHPCEVRTCHAVGQTSKTHTRRAVTTDSSGTADAGKSTQSHHLRLSGRERGRTRAFVLSKSQVVLMGPQWSRAKFVSFSVHRNFLKFWFWSIAWGSETDVFIRTCSWQFWLRQHRTMGFYSLTHSHHHAMGWRYVRNTQRFPTPSTCSGPPRSNSLPYFLPAPHNSDSTWDSMGTGIRYPVHLNYTDTLEPSLPQVGTTASTENTKDALLKTIYSGLSFHCS